MEKKDIFDRIMDRRIMKPFRGFYAAHKEVLLYLFFGGLTTLVSIVIFALFYQSSPTSPTGPGSSRTRRIPGPGSPGRWPPSSADGWPPWAWRRR